MTLDASTEPDDQLPLLAQDDAIREAQRMARAHRLAAETEASNPYFTEKERASRALWHETKAAEWEAKIFAGGG